MSGISGKSIVFVDDEAVMTEIVNDVLNRAGAVSHSTNNPAHAMDLIWRIKPDVIILDRSMPDINGIDLLKKIRGNAAFSQTPIIMLTGAKKDTEVREAIDCGADGYVAKPFSPIALIKQIQVVLKKYDEKWFIKG